MTTRRAAVAGMFYTGDKEKLKKEIEGYLKKAPLTKLPGELKALIVPHAGHIYSGQVAAYAYKLLKEQKKVILLGPSHYEYLSGVAADTHDEWETPLGKISLLDSKFPKLEEAHVQEHCLEVQLPFLQLTLKNFKLLPLVVGDAEPKEVNRQIEPLLDKDTILIISSDLSHFHPYDEAVELDTATNDAIKNLDINSIGEACGKIPIQIVIDLAKRLGWKVKHLEYKNSGDVTGDKSQVVGYSCFAFYK